MDVTLPLMHSLPNRPIHSLLPYNTPTLLATTAPQVPLPLQGLEVLLPMPTPGLMGKLPPLLIH